MHLQVTIHNKSDSVTHQAKAARHMIISILAAVAIET